LIRSGIPKDKEWFPYNRYKFIQHLEADVVAIITNPKKRGPDSRDENPCQALSSRQPLLSGLQLLSETSFNVYLSDAHHGSKLHCALGAGHLGPSCTLSAYRGLRVAAEEPSTDERGGKIKEVCEWPRMYAIIRSEYSTVEALPKLQDLGFTG
jgi:hypothetical protein